MEDEKEIMFRYGRIHYDIRKVLVKVYCRGCKYLFVYKKHELDTNPEYRCKYKDNVMVINSSDWYNESEKKKYIQSPEELNKYNVCQWYEAKEIKGKE